MVSSSEEMNNQASGDIVDEKAINKQTSTGPSNSLDSQQQDSTMTTTTTSTRNENQEAVMMRQFADNLVENIFVEAIDAYQKREQDLLRSESTTGNSVLGEL